MTGGAQAATRSLLYVANSQGDDISIIDLATRKCQDLESGSHRARCLRQADGRRAFATVESENSLK